MDQTATVEQKPMTSQGATLRKICEIEESSQLKALNKTDLMIRELLRSNS
jgi:hypothetical protein